MSKLPLHIIEDFNVFIKLDDFVSELIFGENPSPSLSKRACPFSM